MGGCRCSYRNCSLRTDGKTHMFHYPVFDKVRCHQWLTNAHKLEFLNLKVSQLKNRVVCQHHFKDENFMNFKKDKLTFDAVPTEDGPYCDSSQLESKTKTEQDDTKVFSISPDDIENEYLTIVDKKANFSVKYGDFLTNCDLMDLDILSSLNQMNDNNNQITLRNMPVMDSNINIPPRLVKSHTPLGKGKNYGNSSNKLNLNDKANNTRSVIQAPTQTTLHQNKGDGEQQSFLLPKSQDHPDLLFNVSLVPVEYDGSTQNNQNIEQTAHSQLIDESKQFNETVKLSESMQLNKSIKLSESMQMNEANQLNDLIQLNDLKPSAVYKPPDRAPNKGIAKDKKIRIISEKRISEHVPVIGKLEPVSPNRILTFPNRRRAIANKPVEKKAEVAVTDVILPKTDNIVQAKMQNEPSRVAIKENITSPEKLPTNVPKPNEISPNASLLKSKIPPERMAAIAEKRKFNMKLRDIIEDCLDKLDEPTKSDFNRQNRKVSQKTKVMENKEENVGVSLSKHPELPSVQDYTLAYLEARMKKMEHNLLTKIEENSHKIGQIHQTITPTGVKKNVHTQTSINEDLHKKQLYQDISKYLSKEANSLIYEELFINKYTQDVPKDSKRRKRR